MKNINSIIKCCKNAPSCPNCNNKVTFVIKGELFGKKWSILNDYNLKPDRDYTNLGVLFGDDRDPTWICRQCKKEFDDDMEELYSCTMAKYGVVPKRCCKDLKNIKERYGFNKNATCNGCIHSDSK